MHRHRKMPVQLSIPLKDDAKYFSRSRTEIKPSLSGSVQRSRNWPLHSKSNVKLEVGLKPAAISLPILLHYLAAAQLDSIAVVLFIISSLRGRLDGRGRSLGLGALVRRDTKQTKPCTMPTAFRKTTVSIDTRERTHWRDGRRME